MDEDRESPFQVEVPTEGKFGFRLLIHNGRGASSRPPQPGEAADLWVAIDRSPPQGAVRSARFIEGAQGKQLTVSWDVADANLAAAPIQLSYSDRPDGPWMPLDRPVANTGRHDWKLDFRLPPEIYLKLAHKGSLKAGSDADVTVIDPHLKWEVDTSHFKSKSSNSPLLGWTLHGKATDVVVGGLIKKRST